jgi:hypothetical protein
MFTEAPPQRLPGLFAMCEFYVWASWGLEGCAPYNAAARCGDL